MIHVACCILFSLALIGCTRVTPFEAEKGARSCSAHIHGGTVGNGGEDFLSEVDSAIFLEARPIRTCYVRSSTFGLEDNEIRAQLREAFNIWRSYLEKKGINDATLRPDRLLRQGTPELHFVERLLDKCDGTEDLTFYLGYEDEHIGRARAQFENPVAFYSRVPETTTLNWGKAYIWIAAQNTLEASLPNWKVPTAFLGTVLHELGHILGCSHNPLTIMQSPFVPLLRKLADLSIPWNQRRLDRVDLGRELVLNLRGQQYAWDKTVAPGSTGAGESAHLIFHGQRDGLHGVSYQGAGRLDTVRLDNITHVAFQSVGGPVFRVVSSSNRSRYELDHEIYSVSETVLLFARAIGPRFFPTRVVGRLNGVDSYFTLFREGDSNMSPILNVF